MKAITVALAASLLAGAASSASAQTTGSDDAGSFLLRLRAVAVVPDPSATITSSGRTIGGTTSVTNSLIPEADLTYFVTNNIAIEAIAGVTEHTVTNSVAGRVGSVSLLPPTVTAQYHFDPVETIRPYVGAGVNYTFFYNANNGLPNLGFKNNFGWALEAGADVPLGASAYFLNVDAKKLFLNTSIHAAGGTVQAKASLDPWLLGVGVGMRM